MIHNERVNVALVVCGLMFPACRDWSDSVVMSPAQSATTVELSEPTSIESCCGDAGLGDGFVVWESNRSGAWRIWSRRLDGSELRQLSPDVPGEQHGCPHISPDGQRLSYMSFRTGEEAYPAFSSQGKSGVLHLMRSDGSDVKVIAPSARTYFERRAVVWHSPTQLVYIDNETGYTKRLDLDTGELTSLTNAPPPDHGAWLIDRTLRYATTGTPGFALYDASTARVSARRMLGGCQPYFTHDGRWGYWVAGAGGPILRMDLASETTSYIVRKHDLRMPEDRRYVYFPMFSRSGLLFAMAASAYQHDHFQADYDVFVVPSDPDTLELIDPPVRMTSHTATDRYPDVYLAPIELGRHYVEAPHTLSFASGEYADGWTWDYADGSTTASGTDGYTYTRPGRYQVRARKGDRAITGQVIVRQGSTTAT